jgi:hypothetical protein
MVGDGVSATASTRTTFLLGFNGGLQGGGVDRQRAGHAIIWLLVGLTNAVTLRAVRSRRSGTQDQNVCQGK